MLSQFLSHELDFAGQKFYSCFRQGLGLNLRFPMFPTMSFMHHGNSVNVGGSELKPFLAFLEH